VSTFVHGHRRHPDWGGKESPTYSSWRSMRKRCTDPSRRDFKWYGARGITFDPRWESFEVFLADMGEAPSHGYDLSRLDHARGYCADNCVWTPREENRW
jgi:hypothetical protein